MTRMAILGFQEKLGRAALPNMDQDVNKARDALNALCNK
jgi:hypothetical protein